MNNKNKMTIDELIAYYNRNAEKYEYDNGAARALEIDAKPIIDAQAATIAQLREALEQAEKVVEWAHRYIHADTNEKDTQAFYGMRKAVVLYKKNAAHALKGE